MNDFTFGKRWFSSEIWEGISHILVWNRVEVSGRTAHIVSFFFFLGVPSPRISTRTDSFRTFLDQRFDYLKVNSWKWSGQFPAKLTNRSTALRPSVDIKNAAKIHPAVKVPTRFVYIRLTIHLNVTISLPLSQCSPWKLAVHWQVRLSPFGEHVAPFLHGLLYLQASIKITKIVILIQDPHEDIAIRVNVSIVERSEKLFKSIWHKMQG